ncbi:hypothetical protein DL96DRAFT_1830349 [Flagelloscypha sp. PMI_526]|nr:hypothetical protein DL96DRAFT_1830349 [Flagelloscypha sp. PMI_526]
MQSIFRSITTSAELPDLVPTGQLRDRVLYTKDTLELLFESSLDVHRLSADVLTSFMKRRLATFWNLRLRKLIPDVADVPGFLDLPLFPTLIGADHVSLQTVRRSGLIADLADHTTLSLAPILDRLDLVLIREDKIYQDLLHIHPSELAQLDLESRHTLSQWLRSRVSSLTEESTLIQMRRLPLWMCSRGGTEEVTEFVSADSLTVVPRTLNLSLLRPYLSANVWYIEEAACHGINHLDVNGPSITYLTPSTLVLGLVLPRQLRVEETGPFVSVLRAVIDFAESSTLQHISVPREDLQMVQPRQLYSFSVELFRQCFRGPRHSTPPFLHQQFLRFEPKFIESAQLQHDITYEAFLECAQSVSQALDNVSDNEVEVPFLERSHALFAYYNNNLPNQLMSSEQEWARLARFRFIPRAAFRRRSNVEGTSLESGCRILPRIVSPHDLVLPDFESVCWSQLARFEPDNLPTPNLIILNQKLGHPTCHNVVEHLKFLALHAAPSYPHALWLLNDLKATYHWLQNNLEQCSPLLAANSAEKLFLNADNPSLDSWVWRGADSLIFDLAYDIPRENIFAVHSFLTNNFRALLNAAGAKTIHDPDLMPLDYSGPVGSADLKSMFSQMWQKGELLDLEFVPLDTRNSIAAVADPGINSLRGHRAFIAACVPHLLESLQSGMRESLSFQYYLDETTAFVASKVIGAPTPTAIVIDLMNWIKFHSEFLYTEKITLPVVPQDDNGDFAGALFVDVLEILPLADRWEMESLKDYLALLLKESGLITPDSHDRAREEARKFSATRLEDYCVRYGERNSSVLNRLSIAFDGN